MRLCAHSCHQARAASRLICRVHKSRRRRKDQRKGFTEADYAKLLDAAHQQLAGPIVVVWDNTGMQGWPRCSV